MAANRSNAFTLLELVLVMVLIAAALAIVAPSLSGWGRGVRLDSATEVVVSAAWYAREQAATHAVPQTLMADASGGACEVAPAAGWAAGAATGVARWFALPRDVALTMHTPDGGTVDRVTFYPDGRADAVVLRLTGERGGVVELVHATPAAGFEVRQDGVAR